MTRSLRDGTVPAPMRTPRRPVRPEPRFDDGEPALAFLRRLWRLDRALERVSAGMERTLGVTAQQRLLLRLLQEKPEARASDLASFLHVDRGTVSVALKRLELRGLVSRERDDHDGRAQRLRLTLAGEAVCAAGEFTVEAAVRELLASIPPEDVVATTRLMHRLSSLLEERVGVVVA